MGTLGGTGLNLGLCIKHFNCLFKIISFRYALRVSVKKKQIILMIYNSLMQIINIFLSQKFIVKYKLIYI